jgi:hypothetical protein
MLERFACVESFLLAMFFAAAWGAHLLWATVFFPPTAAKPPQSLFDWLATPYAPRLPRFWFVVVSCLYTFALVGIIVAAITGVRTRPALAFASVCGLLHSGMVFGIFVPINLKLGLDPGGPGARSLDAAAIKMLLRRWGGWNFVRIGVETAGLIAALLAFKAS